MGVPEAMKITTFTLPEACCDPFARSTKKKFLRSVARNAIEAGESHGRCRRAKSVFKQLAPVMI